MTAGYVPSMTVKSDSTTTAGCIYVGSVNSSTPDDNKANWTIKRITITQDNDVSIEYAGGEQTPKYKWSERATLTYK